MPLSCDAARQEPAVRIMRLSPTLSSGGRCVQAV
jgi:hypothetical protein